MMLSFTVSLGRPGGNRTQQAGHTNLGTNRLWDSQPLNGVSQPETAMKNHGLEAWKMCLKRKYSTP